MSWNEYDLLLVEWIDSTQPTGSWQWIDGVRYAVVEPRTVGFFLGHSDKGITLAMSMATDDDGDVQVSGVVTIPRRTVTRITKIVEKEM